MPKGYPRTMFEILNQTTAQEITQDLAGDSLVPVAMAAYTSDKGSEDWQEFTNLSDFVNQTGNISFVKHGQAQLTVAEELRAGATVLCKRMLPNDAALANTTIRARVVKNGNTSYVYYYTVSGVGDKTFDDACESGTNPVDVVMDESRYVDVALFTVAPMGRGTSNMFFSIVPEYSAFKSASSAKYTFEVYENGELIENILFTMNPDVVINGEAQGINPKVKANATQVKVNAYEDGFYKLITELAKTAVDASGNAISINDLANLDFINGKYRDGKTRITGIVTEVLTDTVATDPWTTNTPEFKKYELNEDGTIKTETNEETGTTTQVTQTVTDIVYYHLDGNSETGLIPLTNGSYGSIGDTPMDNPTVYETMLRATFGDTTITSAYLFDPIIYDVDMYKVDFICDCAFPVSVKKAITALVDTRGDMIFLTDLGTSVKTIDDIKTAVNSIGINSNYAALYCNWFKIYDPYSSKQITVTTPFLLARKMVTHILGGVARPFCGILHGITFPEIIYGSLNFRPINLPNDIDQKQALADMNVNYISYYDGVAVMETEYTNYAGYDQFSYLNNIMAVQEVIKAIRSECPKMRYTFMDGSDLETYISDCTAIINRYNSNFDNISMQYMADATYEANKIFYATIMVKFKNFIQEEYFRVIAID